MTVADAGPGPDGDFSHDIARSLVEPYVRAARRNGALLVLDLQPGRSDFLTVAKRWRWALESPYVGLALDPEWRMGPRQVPGRTIGSVSAREVNRVSAWLAELVEARSLPEKVFMLHQFRSDMIPDIETSSSATGWRSSSTSTASATPARSSRPTTRSPGPGGSRWASSSSTTRTGPG